MSASAERVRRYREKKKAQGLRLVQRWVIDTRSPEFLEQARRDSLAIAASEQDKDDQAFLESIADTTGWEWDETR